MRKRCDFSTPTHRCQSDAIYTVTYYLAGQQRSAKRCGEHNTAAHLPVGATGVESEFQSGDSWGNDADAWKR